MKLGLEGPHLKQQRTLSAKIEQAANLAEGKPQGMYAKLSITHCLCKQGKVFEFCRLGSGDQDLQAERCVLRTELHACNHKQSFQSKSNTYLQRTLGSDFMTDSLLLLVTG